MRAVITNTTRLTGVPTPVALKITRDLTYDNPEYKKRKLKKQPVWGIEPKIKLYSYDNGALILPRGYSDSLQPFDIHVDDQTVPGPRVDFGKWNQNYLLYQEQWEAIEALKSTGNGVLVAPAGSGKTVVGMYYIMLQERPALWLTHTKDLLYQSKAAAEKLLGGVGRVGVLGDGKQDLGDGKLIVATVQTLRDNAKLMDTLQQFIGTVVVDEAHHVGSPAFTDIVAKLPARNMLGITATPERKDGLEFILYNCMGPIRHTITRDNLYESGRLIKPKLKFIYTDFSYEQASDRNAINSVDAGGEQLDYRALLDALIDDEDRVDLIADNIISNITKGAFQLVITESVRYCYKLRDKVAKIVPSARLAVIHGPVQRYGWRVANKRTPGARFSKRLRRWEVKKELLTEAEHTQWKITNQARKDILQLAKERKLDVLFATQLAREGLDLPNLTVGHMAMPKRGDATGSKNGASVEQEIGRVMRADPLNPGKVATWYDYVDYNVGVFKSQYHSRRSVYKRLGIKVPSKPKTKMEDLDRFLGSLF